MMPDQRFGLEASSHRLAMQQSSSSGGRGSSRRATSIPFLRWLLLALLCLGWPSAGFAEEKTPTLVYQTESDLPYRSGDGLSEYEKERCRLDVYHPADSKDFATVVWFHGGGLTGGNRSVPVGLQKQGIAIVAANYRLSPQVKSPAYIEDAAAAVAWTFKNIERFGGNPAKIYVSGHSAGGYLTSMVGLDKKWLAAHDIDANRIAGLIPYSGQCITHFTIRAERGISDKQPVVDEMAPLFHVRQDAPPLLLITGDRELELLGRYEETAYLWRMMKIAGHTQTELRELEGFSHGDMAEPAHHLLLRHVRQGSQ